MSADYQHSLIRVERVARVYIREGARSTGDSGERGKRFRTDEGTSPRLVIWYGSDQENKAVGARVGPLEDLFSTTHIVFICIIGLW